MIELYFNPGLIPMVLALSIPFLPGVIRNVVLLASPVLVLILVLFATPVPVADEFIGVLRYSLSPTLFGPFFATVFTLALFAGNLFALKTASALELSGAMLCGGGAIYASLCGDLLSLFIVCELMMLGSIAIIFSERTHLSTPAALHYLGIHVLSGLLLLIGVAGIVLTTNDASLRPLDPQSLFYWFVLASFLINAGGPPFSALLAEAYPEASPSGSVYLSAFTTKVAVFALLTLFAGEALLIPFGLYMIFYGIVYALGENDIRRILAYSIVNQVGFMLVGIGIGTSLALYGAAMHAFAHILYKGVLMMSAGSVVLQTRQDLCTNLGGLFRTMHITTFCGIVGALSISSFPLTSGFVSKSIIEQAALEMNLIWLWLALIVASAGVFLHAGIKFPWFVFFQKDSGLRVQDPPVNMCIAMFFVAGLCLLFGVFPHLLYQLHTEQALYTPYSAARTITKLQLLLFSGAAFFAFLPVLKRKRVITLDWDWFYRKLLPQAFRLVCKYLTLALSLPRHWANHWQVFYNRLFCSAPWVVLTQKCATHSMALGLVIFLSLLLFLVLI